MSVARPWYVGNNGSDPSSAVALRYFVVRDGRLGPEFYETPGTRKIAFFTSHSAAKTQADRLNALSFEVRS